METDFHQVSDLSRKYGSGRQIDDPARYFRQYMGLIEGERKLIYVSALCRVDSKERWREHLYQVYDGGSCAWQALYDVSTRKFVAVSVNGFA